MYRSLTLLFFLFLALICGCSDTAAPVDSKPSYSELVVTYNAELAALDRLEAKKEKLVVAFDSAMTAAQPKPKSGDALAPAELLEKAKAMLADGGEIDTGGDPNALLDQLVERAENKGEITDQVLGLLARKADASDTVEAPAEPTEEELAAMAAVKEEFEPKIAEIDKEIQEQVSRVDRARKARDEAESAQKEAPSNE